MNEDKNGSQDVPPRPRRKSSARKRKSAGRKRRGVSAHGREAVMTLVSIMKDGEDPRLQIAAAKALLSRKDPAAEDAQPEALKELTANDVDHALTIAKKLLDELASLKAASVPGAGGVAVEGAAKSDNT